jgi:hypothetical protein
MRVVEVTDLAQAMRHALPPGSVAGSVTKLEDRRR